MTAITLDLRRSPARSGSLPWWAAIAMAVMSGCLLSLAYSLHPLWWAAWMAPAPVIAAALVSAPGRARPLGAVAGLLGGFTTFSYYASVLSWPIATGILLARALLWSAMIMIALRSAQRLPAWLAVFAPAAFGAGAETVVLALSPHGTYGSFAYSQMDVLPVIQIAALGGVPAIVFLVLCGGSLGGLAAARLMGAAIPLRQFAAAATLVAAVVGGALMYGAVRLASSSHGALVPVSLIVTDRFAAEPRDWTRVWASYQPIAAAAAKPGGVIVLPEKIALLTPETQTEAARQVSHFAQTSRTTVVVGVEVHEGSRLYTNRALVGEPDGSIRWYDKRHPVPGLEARDRAGDRPLVVQAGGAPAGVAICKDMHFPQLGRDYARSAALVLVPAWDFVRDGWMSDRLSALRGVEGGYAIARATREGVSSVSDRFGRILAEMTSGRGVTALNVDLQLDSRPHPTFYGRAGDAFGWIAALSAAVLLIWLRLVPPGAGEGDYGRRGRQR